MLSSMSAYSGPRWLIICLAESCSTSSGSGTGPGMRRFGSEFCVISGGINVGVCLRSILDWEALENADESVFAAASAEDDEVAMEQIFGGDWARRVFDAFRVEVHSPLLDGATDIA